MEPTFPSNRCAAAACAVAVSAILFSLPAVLAQESTAPELPNASDQKAATEREQELASMRQSEEKLGTKDEDRDALIRDYLKLDAPADACRLADTSIKRLATAGSPQLKDEASRARAIRTFRERFTNELIKYARRGGDILPVLKHHARDLDATPASASHQGELARIYYARSIYLATFAQGQSQAHLTAACLLQRKSLEIDPSYAMPEMAQAESELTEKLNRFKTGGTTLIKRGSGWGFHAGEPFADKAWSTSDFEDTFWSVEDAPLGFGREGLRTETASNLPDGRPVVTTYFRRYFTVKEPEDIDTLLARVRCDGGVVLYLNGVDVGRLRLPSGKLKPDTLAAAPSAVDGETSNRSISIPCAALVEGSNTLAVEAHQAGPKAAGLLFDLELIANLPTATQALATITDADLAISMGELWKTLPESLRKQITAK